MNAREPRARPSTLADLVPELQRGGGRLAEVARRLGPDWTEDRVRTALAELFSNAVVGHNPEVGLWWVG